MDKGFSVELYDKRYVKSISLSNESHDRVLIDGVLGQLSSVNIIEDAVLEFNGKNGVIRIDVDPDLLRKSLLKQCEGQGSDSGAKMVEKR